MNNRKCKYCGCDISHLKANATICKSKECQTKYKYDLTYKEKEPRFCEVCGTSIDNLPGQRRICLNPECISEQKRRKYNSTLKEKICKKCGKTFMGTLKQTCCKECRNKKSINYPVIEQKILCRYCNTILETKQVKLTSKTLLEKHGKKVCDKCKEINRKKVSDNMKQNNPMFNDRIKQKSIETKRDNYIELCKKEGRTPGMRKGAKGETKEMTVKRMKLHNPMFNPETRKKVSETFKRKIANGEIIYKKGKENSLWRGNRNFNKAVRIELRNWVQECFKEVNYTCQQCGKTHTELQVHHLEPLRDIISNFLNQYNYTQEYINKIEGTKEYFDFIQKIVEYHYNNPKIGIVLCPECHNKIDSYYKRKTYENNINKKDSV